MSDIRNDGSEAIAEAKRAWQKLQDEAAADTRPDRDPAVVTRRLLCTVAATIGIAMVAGVIGAMAPIGMGGFLLFLLIELVIGNAGVAWALKRPKAPDAKEMADIPVADLSKTTISWIGSRSRALPAPARTIMTSISDRLGTLDPLIARLDPKGPEAIEVRGLLAEQLPALVDEYERVPASLRSVDRNGQSPEQTLRQGLVLIEKESAELLERLAQADLDGLQTRGRYLDLKYGDPA